MRPIGEYSPETEWRTAGSGSARWCIARRGLQSYFVKQFLRPVYPAEGAPLYAARLSRCEQFERRKQRLYAALGCVIGETLVPVVDFFRFQQHYYAVSEAIREPHPTAESAPELTRRAKRELMCDVAQCLQRLHIQGVVHADLKPEHVFVVNEPTGCRARLIDLDSGFLADDPPPQEDDLEGDPVYLAPETFLRMAGSGEALTPKLDTFAFGAMLHRVWTGELPGFDRERYAYLYEAVLDGAEIAMSPALPLAYRLMTRRMLQKDPADRPDDAELVRLLSASFRDDAARKREDKPLNGLSRYMRG